MRMNGRAAHRLRQEQRGAVVMIVAIALMVLLGMLVLTVDLGNVVAVRRDMVNGADSAAIAAARECAEGNLTASAQAAASDLVVSNKVDATVSGFSAPECDAGAGTVAGSRFVEVEGTVDIEYFFAQIFGFQSGPVTKKAVAVWGPAVSLFGAAPIRVSQGAVGDCIASGEGPDHAECAFAYDNDVNSSQWGILNFPEGWPEEAPGPPLPCDASGGQADVQQYLMGDGTPFEAYVPTPPGYVDVCAAPGIQVATINTINNMIAQLAPDPYILTFPVASGAYELAGNQQVVTVVGFVTLQVLGAWHGQEADEHCTFPEGTSNNSKFCIQMEYIGAKVVPGARPGDGLDFGTRAVQLVD